MKTVFNRKDIDFTKEPMFFGEDQSRYIIEIEQSNLDQVTKLLNDDKIYFENIGKTQNKYFEVEEELKITINDLFKINNTWYNTY